MQPFLHTHLSVMYTPCLHRYHPSTEVSLPLLNNSIPGNHDSPFFVCGLCACRTYAHMRMGMLAHQGQRRALGTLLYCSPHIFLRWHFSLHLELGGLTVTLCGWPISATHRHTHLWLGIWTQVLKPVKQKLSNRTISPSPVDFTLSKHLG